MMRLFLVFGSIFVPLLMIGLQRKWHKLGLIYNLLAILSSLIFGNIGAISIYDIITNKTVFMTTIHAVFLNPFFLITGAYLGVYLLYLLVYWNLKGK